MELFFKHGLVFAQFLVGIIMLTLIYYIGKTLGCHQPAIDVHEWVAGKRLVF
jgi:hypothetical protein